MLRRRIAQHLKDRDWTAIVLDLAIVVVGVFLGIQLGNWNTSLNQRAAERAYLERLRDDIVSNRDLLDPFMARRERRLAVINRVEEMYFGDTGVQPLNETDCTKLANAYITTLPPIEIPSVSEAFAAGKIDLVSDQELAGALIAIKQSEDRTRHAIESITNTIPNLARDFPEAVIRMRATKPVLDPLDAPISSSYVLAARCPFLDGRAEPAFLGALAETTFLNTAYLTLLKRHIAKLDALEAQLTEKISK